MKIITSQYLARCVAQEWKGRYLLPNGRWGETLSGSSEVKYLDLLSLGENPTPEDISKVIGNSSWTDLSCDECGNNVDRVIHLGEEQDYDSRTVLICGTCLERASGLMGHSND
jgi:hypothetical protein